MSKTRTKAQTAKQARQQEAKQQREESAFQLKHQDQVIATLKGVIVKGLGGFYFVQTDQGNYSCSLRGRLKKSDLGVLVGDRVEISVLAMEDGVADGLAKGVVEKILPRTNQLLRPKVANVSRGLIVLAAADPNPDYMLLDRLLILMEMAGISPAICFNKVDLIDENHSFWQEKAVYDRAGFPVIMASTYTGLGKEAIQELLQAQITVVAGPSGAGKSSLLNLMQNGLQLATGTISQKLGRGKHTTRCVELMPLNEGGWVADSPGFSRLDLPKELTAADLGKYYPEFAQPARSCRFDGCCHHKEPECGVKAALAAGEISQDRYDRYLLLLAEIVNRENY